MNKMFKKRFLMAFLKKWKNLKVDKLAYELFSYIEEKVEDNEFSIPKDVPKGHMVVYVGEECKRFVIQVSFLDHPLFRALLDRAQEVYEFNPHSKLCIPCDEAIFLGVLRYVDNSQQGRRIWLCF